MDSNLSEEYWIPLPGSGTKQKDSSVRHESEIDEPRQDNLDKKDEIETDERQKEDSSFAPFVFKKSRQQKHPLKQNPHPTHCPPPPLENSWIEKKLHNIEKFKACDQPSNIQQRSHFRTASSFGKPSRSLTSLTPMNASPYSTAYPYHRSSYPSKKGVYRNNIQCVNCGCIGHIYRECSLPITSYGLICFRWSLTPTGQRVPQYVMVQRKFSLCFVEFVRGKYDLRNRSYIKNLLEKMTEIERHRLLNMSFEELWYGFWNIENSRSHQKDMLYAKEKFKIISNGYFLRPHQSQVTQSQQVASFSSVEDNFCPEQQIEPEMKASMSSGMCYDRQEGTIVDSVNDSPPDETKCKNVLPVERVSLKSLIQNSQCKQFEPEWGFPKGRRDLHEKDLSCAIREFREETSIGMNDINIYTSIKPFEEVFTACNRVRYRHVYYIAQLKQKSLSYGPSLPYPPGLHDQLITDGVTDVSLQGKLAQLREVGRISWLNAEGVLAKIAPQNISRRSMFENVHQMVLNTFQ